MGVKRSRGYPPGFDGRTVTSGTNALKTGLHDAGNRAARRYLAAINRAMQQLEAHEAGQVKADHGPESRGAEPE